MIKIRQASSADKERLFEFYSKAYPGRLEFIKQYWEWAYCSNPLNPPDFVSIWIAEDEDRQQIAGHYGIVFEDVLIDNKTVTIGWGADFYVLPDYRGLGLGKKLQAELNKTLTAYMAISVSGVTRHICLQQGGVELDTVFTMFRALRLEPSEYIEYLVRILRNKAGGRYFSFLLKKCLRLSVLKKLLESMLRAPEFNNGSSIEAVQMVDFDHPLFLDYLKKKREKDSGYPIYNEKTLQWRFKDQPIKDFSILIAKNEKDTDISGYAVIRLGIPPEDRVGIISVFSFEDMALFEKTIQYILHFFHEKGCKAVFSLAPNKTYRKKLKELGFEVIGQDKPIVLSSTHKSLIKYIQKVKFEFNFESQDLDRFPNFRL